MLHTVGSKEVPEISVAKLSVGNKEVPEIRRCITQVEHIFRLMLFRNWGLEPIPEVVGSSSVYSYI